MRTFESEKTLEEIEEKRNGLDEYDREKYDCKLFKECQDRLHDLHMDMQSVGECSLSNFGEAIAEGKDALSVEYKALKRAYNELHDNLQPIMKLTYKGYKAHSEWLRQPFTYHEEFEEPDEDDIYHMLGLD